MKLLSHGNSSDLLEHSREVCLAAVNLEERIICACHDIGKATVAWQTYINKKTEESPHNHAASGGLLASLLIKELNKQDSKFWSLVALHTGSAHHSFLGLNSLNQAEYCQICSDEQAQKFFVDKQFGIASLLPEIPSEYFQKTWDKFRTIAPLSGNAVYEYNNWISLNDSERLKAFLSARSILGRLCYQDHESASKQSGVNTEVSLWDKAYPRKSFNVRSPRNFSTDQNEINRLRVNLKRAFLDSVEYDSCFYFIDAPTGLGKTETMLSAAEKLLSTYNLDRIIFSVPQVSIADQIYEDYFSKKENVQIWNYIRQEKKTAASRYEDNINPEFSLDIAIQPFSESYNITTFNQVLLAMCHPHRARCIKGIGLKDAVIIMDEFHKLPMSILPYFFRIASEYSKSFNCRFIFGSATPIEASEYFGLSDSVRMPPEATEAIYKSTEIDNRRLYNSLGKISIEDLENRIQAFHSTSKKNLLVVLNLVTKGTWLLLKGIHGNYNPWNQLETLKEERKERVVVFLDGLVPPFLRRQIVTACKKAMLLRPVTLITTQMVEVGVDLDFDHALIDYQGIAATIQRGGRVGREGRREPCTAEVFSLLTENEKTSFQVLNEVAVKSDLRFSDIKFKDVASKLLGFWQKEIIFFDRWKTESLRDSDLIRKLKDIQSKIFSKVISDGIIDLFFPEAMGSGELGVDFLSGQMIAELYTSEYGTEILVLGNYEELEKLNILVAKLESKSASFQELKELNKFIIDRKISVSDKIVPELGLNQVGCIKHLDNLRCMTPASCVL